LLQLFCSIALDAIDWIAIGFVAFLLRGLILAFFLYFRTAFKGGGWKNVKCSGWTTLGALAVFVIERIIQNHEIDSLKKFFGNLYKWGSPGISESHLWKRDLLRLTGRR
jgi:hypothetical protein